MSEYASGVRAKNIVEVRTRARVVMIRFAPRQLPSWQLPQQLCWMAVVSPRGRFLDRILWPPFLSPWSPSDGPGAIVVKVKHLSPGCSTESVLAPYRRYKWAIELWLAFNSDQAKHLLCIDSSASVVSRCSYKSVYWKSPPL